jgi:hypothetical protein
MSAPMSTGQFGDLLDKRVTKIFNDRRKQLKDRISDFYSMEKSSDSFERMSEIGSLPDFTEFSGTVTYQAQSQGYDVTATHKEFVNGFQITRDLFDDDRHSVWERKPKALADAFMRTRQKHAARLFNNAFSVDNYFYNHSEGVALCSNSHTTTSGASTASGFDNLVTSSLTATALEAARIQFRGFRGDQAERISVMPDLLVIPVDLYGRAHEIIESIGKPSSANNDANVHKGAYKVVDWEYITDTNDWWLIDSSAMKDMLIWYDRTPLEFGMAEELDTLVAKWRAYARYSSMHRDWRFVLGASVS